MKRQTISGKTVLGGLTVVFCLAVASTAWAKVTGTPDACSYSLCHDMHGAPPNLLKSEYEGNQGCVNCHSSGTSSTTYNLTDGVNTVMVPVVLYTGATAPTEYLAGGNFWWVQTEDSKGHNIFGSNPEDVLTSGAPGISHGAGCSWPASCHFNFDQTNTLAMPGLQGRQGCTKCHMLTDDMDFNAPKGFHHADDTVDPIVGGNFQDPLTDQDFDGFFRFLHGHQSGDNHGVCGIEDPDWQASSGSGDHNEYLGYQNALASTGGLSVTGHTVTSFCSGCHGNFHIQECLPAQQPPCYGDWTRHPAGAVLSDSGEFSNAFGAGGTGTGTYDPDVPVARPSLSSVSSDVNLDTDLVSCLSCHRAHGSPYPKMLRWDPADISQGGRCVTCHTEKVTGTSGQYHYANEGDCNVCHTSHGDGAPDYGPDENMHLVAQSVTTPSSGDKPVVFTAETGTNSLADGDATYDGICEVCHTQTDYYRNNGSGTEHPLYTLGVPVDPDWDCTACHSHRNEFCRAANQIHATHFVSDPGPHFPQNETGCYYCHADGRLQCADDVLFDNSDPKSLAETTICASALCHTNP